MDRPLAGRHAGGRLSRPFNLMTAPVGAVGRTWRPPSRRARASLRQPAGSSSRLAVARRVWAHGRVRLVILVLPVVLVVLGGGWLWLRDSPLVSVQRVRVSGVHGPQAAAIEGALVAAAHRMSTLDVRAGELRAAVSSYPVVSAVRASASFPHELRIRVLEQPAVAALVWGGLRTAVAADGTVLGPGLLTGSLPTVGAFSQPSPGERLHDRTLLACLSVLGAAPAALAGHVKTVFEGPRGLTVAMANGLQVYFGDASRPHAKWFSLARVLADASSAGASYVDVRLPSRPAAGFPGGVAPATATSSSQGVTAEPGANSESTIGALAAGLSAGGAGAGAASSTSPAGTPTGTEAASSPASGSPGAGASGEASPQSPATATETGSPTGSQEPGATPTPSG